MPATRRLGLPAIVLVSLALIAITISTGRVAQSYPDAEKGAVKWEYNTATVEAGELQVKLAEFGTNGWEVFSVHHATQVLEQDQGPKTRLVVEKFQITGRKPATRQ
ncbi:MAG: hypothetical protein HY290_13725 [Planctomycetia bacterium]|nr:hypothetical protein [Planctomycetia bacterium]